MPEVSVWRYGVVGPEVWPLLGERTPSGQTYTVQPGDTPRASPVVGVDVQRIALANRLADPNFLSVGQVLCIPLSRGGFPRLYSAL
jgi:LysM repeat protein